MSEFIPDPQLAADTVFVTDWALSRVLLMNDARYPWLILVPRRPNAVEIHDLVVADRGMLIEEVARAGAALKAATAAKKINIGALGNLVPQLHVHAVARNPGDEAWPGAVWGRGQAIRYDQVSLERLLGVLQQKLA